MVECAATSGPGRALLAFICAHPSRGTDLACRLAAEHGLPLLVYKFGWGRLPMLADGAWAVAAESGFWARWQRWVPMTETEKWLRGQQE